jgi:hypothetical protein
LDFLVKATLSPIPITAVSPPNTGTDAAVVTPTGSSDTDTDIESILGTKEDSQQEESVYSAQDEEYLSFLKDLEKNSSSPTHNEKDFSSWIRSLEESFEQHSIHPRQLFPESPNKTSPGKQVAFSSDHTIRFFSRSKEELMQLRRRKKKRRGNIGCNGANDDSVDEQPFRRYFEEKLKTTEDFVKTIEDSVQSSIGAVSGCLFQPEKTACACHAPQYFRSSVEKEEISDDITPSNNSLADVLLLEDENENSLIVEAPKEGKTSNTSSNSNNSGISGLWFAVPYKSPSHDASLDFIQRMDPKGSPVMNNSLLINPEESLDDSRISNGSNGKNTSSSSSISLDRKKEVVEAAKRWSASQKDFFDSDHTHLVIAAKATDTTAETSHSSSPEVSPDLDDNTVSSSSISPDRKKEVVTAAKRWASSQKAFFDSANQQLDIVAKATETTAETSRSSSPENGPDLDESRNSALVPPSLRPEDGPDLDKSRDWTEKTEESKEWEVAEFGPDLDESRGEWEHKDPDLGLSEQWESFEQETFTATKVTENTAVEDADWVTFPPPTADLPALSLGAPDMDEAKEWKAFQEEKEEETPQKTIRARVQAAPRKEWRIRIANYNRSCAQGNLSDQDAPSENQAPHEAVAPVTSKQEKQENRVKEMARAIELYRAKEMAHGPIVPRVSPSNASVISPLTIESSSTWAEEGKKNPAELSELQFPVLDCERRPDGAQPSPVSVTHL